MTHFFNFRRNSYDDDDIIAGIQGNMVQQNRAIKTLFKSHKGYIHKGRKKYGLSEEDARFAYDLALGQLMKEILDDRFRRDSLLSTMLMTIFLRRCIDILDKKRTNLDTVPIEAIAPGLPQTSQHFLKDFITRDKLDHVKKLLEKIGEKCKEILVMKWEGYSDIEIAELLGYSGPSVVNSRRYTCRKKLKDLM